MSPSKFWSGRQQERRKKMWERNRKEGANEVEGIKWKKGTEMEGHREGGGLEVKNKKTEERAWGQEQIRCW